jgi:thiopurine S-methyltransferase
MQLDYWQQKWDENDIGFNQLQPNALLKRYIGSFDLKPQSRLFVPLCGKSVDMLWLMNAGYQIVGVELSAIACEAFFTENNLAVTISQEQNFTTYCHPKLTLFCGDFFKLTKERLGHIDMVYDRAALVALPSSLRRLYIDHLINLLGPQTSLLLITSAYDQNKMNGPPFSVDEQEVKSLYANFQIKQLYNRPIKNIPKHLHARGLIDAHEQAYHIYPLIFT